MTLLLDNVMSHCFGWPDSFFQMRILFDCPGFQCYIIKVGNDLKAITGTYENHNNSMMADVVDGLYATAVDA